LKLVSTSSTVTVPNHLMARLVGPLNENLRLVEDAFPGARIIARGNEFTIDGVRAEDAAMAERTVEELRLLLERGHSVDAQVVNRTIDMVRADERPSEVLTAEVLRSARGRSVRPKTSGQKRYVDAIRDNVITFSIGPAGTVEVAPLAYMRGRTLNNSFIILDEAQNTTPEQMKMFLTRIGFGSKVVVTGDDTQIDLPGGRSGLAGLEEMFTGIDGLAFVHLGRRDVVRHRIVQDIVSAYEAATVSASPAAARGRRD